MSLINEALKRADADKAGKIPTAANARDLLPAHDRRPAARRRWALRLLAGLMLAGASAWTIHTFVKIPPPGSVQAQVPVKPVCPKVEEETSFEVGPSTRRSVSGLSKPSPLRLRLSYLLVKSSTVSSFR